MATVSVGSKNGTPVLLRDLGTVSFGPDIGEGVAEWNGEGETVGGIIVMRQGMNALNVINGIKQSSGRSLLLCHLVYGSCRDTTAPA